MSGATWRRLGIGVWRELMNRFDAGSATVNEFCAQEGVSVSSFYRWRSLLDKSADKAVVAGDSLCAFGTPARRNEGAAPAFIDLGPLTGSAGKAGNGVDAGASTDGGFELRLELGGGVVLHLSRH